MVSVEQFVSDKFGCTLKDSDRSDDIHRLADVARRRGGELADHLYQAVVGRSDGQELEGRATIDILSKLSSVTAASKEVYRSDPASAALIDLHSMCNRYVTFLEDATRTQGLVKMSKKPLPNMPQGAVPKHSLISVGGKFYESLTWLDERELQSLNAAFADVGGLHCTVDKIKTNQSAGRSTEVYKLALTKGHNAVTRLARDISSGEYLALRKFHPVSGWLRCPPVPEAFIPPRIEKRIGVNDGSTEHIARIQTSFSSLSSKQEVADVGLSTYAHTELGVTDMQTFLDKFMLMRFVVEGGLAQHGLGKLLLENMGKVTNLSIEESSNLSVADRQAIRRTRLENSPFRNPDVVRRFLNTIAFQMLQGVQQMHVRWGANGAINPNNFIFSTQENQLQIKLLDFNSGSSSRQARCMNRRVYAELSTSNHSSSSQPANLSRENDITAIANVIEQVNGSSIPELAIKQNLMDGTAPKMPRGKIAALIASETPKKILALHRVLPNFSNLEQLAQLLKAKDHNQRPSISNALNGPVLRPGELMQPSEFTELAKVALRDIQMIDDRVINVIMPLGSSEASRSRLMQISSSIKQTAREHQIRSFIESHGQQELQARLKEVKRLLNDGYLSRLRNRAASAMGLD